VVRWKPARKLGVIFGFGMADREEPPHNASAPPLSLSAWAPFENPLFRALWFAALGSNMGAWMQNVGAAWLMASLSPSPLQVALVQTATYLPVFLIGLPAGAIADVFDRRKVLLFTQGWMSVSAALLALFTWLDWTGPNLLLLFTFALGAGNALNAPAWQSLIPELVPREQLPTAIALNSVGFNIARAIGPALGGLVVSFLTPAANFTLNAFSFVGVLVVVYAWKRKSKGRQEKSERVVNAIMAGVRYVRYAPELHPVLLRSFLFVIPASAIWSMLPLFARDELGLGGLGYGLMLGALGVGSVAFAAVLPRLRARWSSDQLVAACMVGFGLVNLAMYALNSFVIVLLVLFAGGACWISITSTFNTVAQKSLPNWVRARGLSVYIFLFQGGMALGSTIWGGVAEHGGVRLAILFAALSLLVLAPLSLRWRLSDADDRDVRPSMHWPEPILVEPMPPERGPVLVTTEYCIRLELRPAFLEAMRKLESIRRRDGAIRWGLFEDPANPGRYLESFLVESWAEHLRQHLRVTHSDKAIEDAARSFHNGPNLPKVTHWIADDRG